MFVYQNSSFQRLKNRLFEFREAVLGYPKLKKMFEHFNGYPLDLQHPQTHNAKINRKKIVDRDPLLIQTSDKVKVRDYVKTCLGDREAERILIPVNYPENIEELIHLGVTVKSKSSKNSLYALNIVPSDSGDESKEKYAKKLLGKASVSAAATDHKLTELIRYDSNLVNGITNVVKENKVTDIILGLHKQQGISDTFLGKLTEGILSKCNITAFIYQSHQPLNTVSRYIITVPANAEKEMGFVFWLLRVWNIGRNTGCKLVFYGAEETLKFIKQVQQRFSIEAGFVEFSDWEDFLIISRDLKENEALIVVLSRKNGVSFDPIMDKIPNYLNKYFNKNNYILIFPMQYDVEQNGRHNYLGTSIFNLNTSGTQDFTAFSNLVSKLFKKK